MQRPLNFALVPRAAVTRIGLPGHEHSTRVVENQTARGALRTRRAQNVPLHRGRFCELRQQSHDHQNCLGLSVLPAAEEKSNDLRLLPDCDGPSGEALVPPHVADTGFHNRPRAIVRGLAAVDQHVTRAPPLSVLPLARKRGGDLAAHSTPMCRVRGVEATAS